MKGRNWTASVLGSANENYEEIDYVTADDRLSVKRNFNNNTYYDSLGRLDSITNSSTGTSSYASNALDQRVSKKTPSASENFVFDQTGKLVGEYSQAGALIKETVYLGTIPLATVQPSGEYSILADYLGAPREIQASTKSIVFDWAETSAWGNYGATATQANGFSYNLRFPGQYYDTESNESHNGFRDYNPFTGRYAQSDPIGLLGGIYTYEYVGESPIGYVDPLGLFNITPVGNNGSGYGQQIEYGFDFHPIEETEALAAITGLARFYPESIELASQLASAVRNLTKGVKVLKAKSVGPRKPGMACDDLESKLQNLFTKCTLAMTGCSPEQKPKTS